MYIEALLIVVSNWKLPKYLNKKIEWKNKQTLSCAGELRSKTVHDNIRLHKCNNEQKKTDTKSIYDMIQWYKIWIQANLCC